MERSWSVPAHIPLPAGFVGFDPQSHLPQPGFHSYHRHLPHWRMPGACYFTTYRLNDSLPREVAAELRREAQAWRERLARAAAANDGRVPYEEWAEWEEFQRIRLRKLDAMLDLGHGSCCLREPRHRLAVAAALLHFEGVRCEMLSFCIMPNHVHVLCRPLGGHALESLTGSWKQRSTTRINQALKSRGSLWQQESIDRIIRDEGHYAQVVRYIARNPIRAGLDLREATVWFNPAIRAANGWDEGP